MVAIKTEKVISLQDWDALVEETYSRPYSFQQQDGCKERQRVHFTVPDYADDFDNDEVVETVNGDDMGVSFKAWLARDPKQLLNNEDKWIREHGLGLFWARNFYPEFQTVANDLHERGLIEAGDYVIDIDW